jgi:sugar O-acyltransferase (sialic acid O-acetyltransferase NeuD family)
MKKRIAFLGSGEMARHIAHYMVEDNQFDIAGYYDDFSEVGSLINGYPVLGKISDVENGYKQKKFDELINAIGFTRLEYRKELFEMFDNKVPFGTFIHSTCLVDSTAKIGKGVVVFPFTILYLDAVVEDNVFIQIRSYVTDSIVKKHSMISGTVSIAGRAEVGECCNIGISTTISNDVKICDFVRTGAGTVVVKDITEPGTYVGAPARKIKNTI